MFEDSFFLFSDSLKTIVLPLNYYEDILNEHRFDEGFIEIIIALVIVRLLNGEIELDLDFENTNILDEYIELVQLFYDVENPIIIGESVIFKPNTKAINGM